MKHTYYIISVVIVFSLLPPIFTNSQDEQMRTKNEMTAAQMTQISTKDLEIHETMETLRESYLIQKLQLPEEKAQVLIAKMRYSKKLKQGYLLKQYTLENELETLLEVPNPESDKINTVLQKLEIAKLQYFQQMLQINEELQNTLTPEEQAQYVIFQRKFHRKLKTLITSIRQQGTNTIQNNQILRKKDSESVIRQP